MYLCIFVSDFVPPPRCVSSKQGCLCDMGQQSLPRSSSVESSCLCEEKWRAECEEEASDALFYFIS